MFEQKFNFIDAKKAYPVFSGEYLVITEYGHLIEVSYSSVHHAFNVHDFVTESEASETKLDVVAWADTREQEKVLKTHFLGGEHNAKL